MTRSRPLGGGRDLVVGALDRRAMCCTTTVGPTPAVAAVRRALREALSDLADGDLVLVACSGGADSLALAAALAFEHDRLGLRAGGVTIDHSLQPESAAQAERTVAVLADLGLDPVGSVRVDVGSAGGPEAAARQARFAALDTVAETEAAAAVLLGHTRDDQAETVLLGLARGSGARSLSGMPARAGRFRRPLLELSRATTVAACADEGLTPWDDPHNADPAFARARVRHHVLPVLEATIGPGVAAALARTASQLRDDADALDSWAIDAYAQCVDSDGHLEVDALGRLPPAVRTRVLRRAALAAGAPATDLTAGHVEALDRLVLDWHGQGPLDLPAKVSATRRDGRIVLSRQRAGARP